MDQSWVLASILAPRTNCVLISWNQGLYVNPMPPLEYAGSCLTNLVFICSPSLSGSTSPESVRSPSLRKTNRPEKGKTYLAVTSVDFHDCKWDSISASWELSVLCKILSRRPRNYLYIP